MAKTVSIFGGAEAREGSKAYRDAFKLGELLARAGYIVMNGGYGGTMTASAKGARQAGGKTIGVTTRDFGPSKPNPWIDREIRLPHWQDRLIYLVTKSHASIALPGKVGTLIEIAVTLEMIRKGLIPRKPVILIGSSWKKIFVPYLREENKSLQSLFHSVSSPEQVIPLL